MRGLECMYGLFSTHEETIFLRQRCVNGQWVFILSSFTLHVSSASRVSWLKSSRKLLLLAACGLNLFAPVPLRHRLFLGKVSSIAVGEGYTANNVSWTNGL